MADILDVDDNSLSFLDDIKKDDNSINDTINDVKNSIEGVLKIEAANINDITDSKIISSDGISLPKLVGSKYPKEYIDIVDRILLKYKNLPNISYRELYRELADLTIKSSATPTLQVINQELQRAQAAKERATEIMKDITTCFIFKERAVDILQDAWGNFSEEKSADKRKGDAVFRLNEFLIDLAETEAALKASIHIAKNLDSLQENLSRRITIFQLQLKLHDMGRGGLPEFNFGKDTDDDFGFNKKIDRKQE